MYIYIYVIVPGLSKLPSDEAKELAFDLAQNWIRTNLRAFDKYDAMFEKVRTVVATLVPTCGPLLSHSNSVCLFPHPLHLSLSLSLQYDVNGDGKPGGGGEYDVQVFTFSFFFLFKLFCWQE